MSPRNTGTGAILETMILPSLKFGGYEVKKQVTVGTRPGGGRHKIDVVARNTNGESFLVSLKWQQTSGTAEQKVPFEVICLWDAVEDFEEYKHAFLVLGGEGWKLRDFYVGDGLSKYMNYKHAVTILTLEAFVARANQGKL